MDDDDDDVVSNIIKNHPNQQRIRTVADSTLTAYALYRRIRTIGVVFLAIVSMLTTWYLLFFIVMEDRQWYDWMRLWQLAVILGLLLLVCKPTYVMRMFDLVLVLTFIALVFDIIAVSYINPLDINAAEGTTKARQNVKELLLIFSIFFVSLDVILFIIALYYRFFSALSDDYILDLYSRVATSAPRWFQLAIMADITNTTDNGIKTRARQQVASKQQYDSDTRYLENLITPAAQSTPTPISPARAAAPSTTTTPAAPASLLVESHFAIKTAGSTTQSAADEMRKLSGPDGVDCTYVTKPRGDTNKKKKF